jgi:hypothetical protein
MAVGVTGVVVELVNRPAIRFRNFSIVGKASSAALTPPKIQAMAFGMKSSKAVI